MRSLALSKFESRGTSFVIFGLSADELASLLDRGELSFGRTDRGLAIWEQATESDLLCAYHIAGQLTLVAAVVVSKKLNVSGAGSVDRPFQLMFDVVGKAEFKAHIEREVFFGLQELDCRAARNSFKTLWEACTEWRGQPLTLPERATSAFSESEFQIRVAFTAADRSFISRSALSHPFGLKNGLITLIAFRDDVPQAAVTADFSSTSNRRHSSALRLFRGEYERIRKNAVFVHRLYTGDSCRRRIRTHEALLRVLSRIAPKLLGEPLSIIESVSYDFHPAGPRADFNFEAPRRENESFYYWKAFNLTRDVSGGRSKQDMSIVHRTLGRRAKKKYWLCFGRQKYLELGARRHQWALRSKPTNIGNWRLIENGDTLFFADEKTRIRFTGEAVATKRSYESEFPGLQLWIDLKNVKWVAEAIDLDEYMTRKWFTSQRSAGIALVPNELGALLADEVEARAMQGKMQVLPNPYILHRVRFDVVPNQIFLVQSWDLRETIRPTIRRILEKDGYKVVGSDDREGQMVFDDVWLMLNESEVVLVDFTGQRPNVYLEFGMTLVLGKPVAAITQRREDLPSDTPDLKYILYSDKLGDKALEQRLGRSIRDTIQDLARFQARG